MGKKKKKSTKQVELYRFVELIVNAELNFVLLRGISIFMHDKHVRVRFNARGSVCVFLAELVVGGVRQ